MPFINADLIKRRKNFPVEKNMITTWKRGRTSVSAPAASPVLVFPRGQRSLVKPL
jgi:hypothetical protein